jgi:hypothetical protein
MEPTFLVWSNEHGGWWRKGGYGYTLDLAVAGRYSQEAADGIVDRASRGGPRGALSGGVYVYPEVAVLAPECRWGSGPPDQVDMMGAVARAAEFKPHDHREHKMSDDETSVILGDHREVTVAIVLAALGRDSALDPTAFGVRP